MFHGSTIEERVDIEHQNCNDDTRKTDMTVPVDDCYCQIETCDLDKSLLESMVVGGMVSRSVGSYSEETDVENKSSKTQSDVDDKFEFLSDVEENSILRDSTDELTDKLSDRVLASRRRSTESSKNSARKSLIIAKARKPMKEAKSSKSDVTEGPEEKSSSKRTADTTEAAETGSTVSTTSEVVLSSKRTSDTTEPTETDSSIPTVTEPASKRQQNHDEKSSKPTTRGEKEPTSESARESVAKKRAQMKLLAKESVASKRAKAMLKFQEAEKGPCISDNCRDRGSFESEEQELDRLLKAEEEREAKLLERPDKCIGFMQRQFEKSAFKPSLYMNLYKEPMTLRRVKRHPAQPSAPKKASKPNKTSELRYKYLHNQKIVSSNAAEHLKKFKRLPFRNPSKYGHTCRDRPAHFGLQRDTKVMEKQIKLARDRDRQLLQDRPTTPTTTPTSGN